MDYRQAAFCVLLNVSVFSSASAFESESEILDLRNVPDNTWTAACQRERQALKSEPYVDLKAPEKIDLGSLGSTPVEAFGINFSLPFEIKSVSANLFANEGTLLVKGDNSQNFLASVDSTQRFETLVALPRYNDMVLEFLGEAATHGKIIHEALQIDADDIGCSLSTRKDDVWRIAIIREKRLLRGRSESIQAAYLVESDGWIGFATCFERDSYLMLYVELESAGRRHSSSIKAVGSCAGKDSE